MSVLYVQLSSLITCISYAWAQPWSLLLPSSTYISQPLTSTTAQAARFDHQACSTSSVPDNDSDRVQHDVSAFTSIKRSECKASLKREGAVSGCDDLFVPSHIRLLFSVVHEISGIRKLGPPPHRVAHAYFPSLLLTNGARSRH